MRHYYKVHGKHCFLRSFQTKCLKCGAEVLYWECTHGSKIFFNYPPYGKLIRHFCRQYISKNRKKKFPIIIKKPKGLLEKASPSCPICGKLFKTKEDLKEHLKQLKNDDFLHNQLFEDKILFENKDSKKNYKKYHENKIHYKPKFGTINIKKSNK